MDQTNRNADRTALHGGSASKRVVRKKLLSIELVAFLFVAVYIAGYTLNMLNKPKIATETVAYGQIDTPRQFSGIILRDETVAFADEAGVVIFSYAENEYIKKDSNVCVVRSGDNIATLERQIGSINDDILTKSALSADSQASSETLIESEELRRINAKMKVEANASVPLFMTGDTNEAYRLKKQLEKDIDARNSILLAGGDRSVAELVDKKLAYERQLTEGSRTYSSAQGGILSYSSDGLEAVFSPKNMLDITREQTEGIFEKAASVERHVDVGGRLFKIVNSNAWYLCAYIDSELAVDWSVGASRFIYFNEGGSYEKTLMRIEHIEQRDDKKFVIFSSSKYLLSFINKRSVKFSLEDNTFKGLKIPNTAITQKTALLIPSDYIYEFRGSQGVYITEGERSVFKAVRVLSQKNDMTRILQSFNNIKLGDTIYTYENGAANLSSGYVISEIATAPGLYVANSGSAEFRQIDVLNSNEYYSIIENSQSLVGVRYFDSIVSDASTVADSQIIR